MFRRLIPVLVVFAGLTAGFLAWLAAGAANPVAVRLDTAEAATRTLRRPRPDAYAPAVANVADMAANPIFALTTGPGAVPEPSVRLDGISRSRSRVAALLSVNEKPPEWLTVGERRDGVTLQEVHGARVIVETVYGPQEVPLGGRIGPAGAAAAAVVPASAPAPAPAPAVGATIVDQMPPGFRSPPPPASAPIGSVR